MFLLSWISVPGEPPSFVSVTPHTTSSVLIQWQVRPRSHAVSSVTCCVLTICISASWRPEPDCGPGRVGCWRAGQRLACKLGGKMVSWYNFQNSKNMTVERTQSELELSSVRRRAGWQGWCRGSGPLNAPGPGRGWQGPEHTPAHRGTFSWWAQATLCSDTERTRCPLSLFSNFGSFC